MNISKLTTVTLILTLAISIVQAQKGINASCKVDNCSFCESSNENSCASYGCRTGAYSKKVSGTTICELCPTNVRACSSPTEHTKCVQGYYVADKTCTKCPDSNPNCLNSSKYDHPNCLTPTSTNSVYDSTYGKGGKCYSCPPGCKSCMDGETCDVCITNTYWDSGTKTCKSCTEKFGEDCSGCNASKCTSECFFNESKFFGKCKDTASVVFYYGLIIIFVLCLICFVPLCILVPMKMVRDRKDRENGNTMANNTNGGQIQSHRTIPDNYM